MKWLKKYSAYRRHRGRYGMKEVKIVPEMLWRDFERLTKYTEFAKSPPPFFLWLTREYKPRDGVSIGASQHFNGKIAVGVVRHRPGEKGRALFREFCTTIAEAYQYAMGFLAMDEVERAT